jgi:hypothetical protein
MRVISFTLISMKRNTKHTFAMTADVMLKARPTLRIAGFGLESTVILLFVRMYQCSVSPGISSKMENGITILEMMGVRR